MMTRRAIDQTLLQRRRRRRRRAFHHRVQVGRNGLSVQKDEGQVVRKE